VTADALHTHAEAAEFLVTEKHAHYLFTVKANQPTLLACCAGLPWRDVPVLDRTRDRAHGRVELRTLKAVTITHVGFPYVAQVLRVPRKTRDLQANPRRWRTVVVNAITSLPFAQASSARLADLLRGHWAIENGLHHARDHTYAEDACQLRTGTPRRSWRPWVTSRSGCSAERAGQPRRRAPPPRPRPRPAPGDPRDHARMNGHSERTTEPWTATGLGRQQPPSRPGDNQLRGQLLICARCQLAGWPGRCGSPPMASYSLRRACWMLASISSGRWGRPWPAAFGSAGSWASHAPGW
jgi:predicted transposase YbfD/YdcC